MNTTHTDNIDDSNPLFIYIMLGIEILNAVVSIWTSWKMGHINLTIDHLKCYCIDINDIHLDIESDE